MSLINNQSDLVDAFGTRQLCYLEVPQSRHAASSVPFASINIDGAATPLVRAQFFVPTMRGIDRGAVAHKSLRGCILVILE